MIVAGLDIGTSFTKAVALSDGTVVGRVKLFQGAESVTTVVTRALEQLTEASGLTQAPSHIAATGVGREEADPSWLKLVDGMCLARAAGKLYPTAGVVLDVGAQKALAVRCTGGKALKFSKNEQCAGGTGRFLDMAAGILMISLAQMDEVAGTASEPVDFQSVCSVFAESEMLSQIHVTKAPVPDIAAGILMALANRLFPLIARVGLQQDVLVTGGVSSSRILREYLGQLLGFAVRLPDDFEYVPAIGAAVIAADTFGG